MTSNRSDLLWTLFGRLGFTGANAVMMLGLYLGNRESFPLERFGTLLVFVQAQLLLSRVFLCGQDQAVVRFHPERGTRALHDGFYWIRRLSIVPLALVVLLQFLLAPLGGIGREFHWPELLFLVFVGAAAQAYLDLAAAALMARFQFRTAGLLLAIGPFLRCAAVLLVPHHRAELAFAVATILIAFLAVRIAHPEIRSRSLLTRDTAPDPERRAALRYGAMIAVADFLVVLGLSAAVFAVKGLGDEYAVTASRLAFAAAISQAHFAVFLAFYQSLLPRASHAASLTDFLALHRQSFRTAIGLSVGLCLMTAVAILVLRPLCERFRPEGLGFEWPLVALTAFMIVIVFEAPLGIACQYLKRPKLQVRGLAVRALIAVVLAFALATQGATAAAAGQTIGAVAGFVVLMRLVRRALLLRGKEVAEACVASQA